MIDWEDVLSGAEPTGRPRTTHQLAICGVCGNTMVLRLPQKTYHRHIAAARAGLQPLTHCPKCQNPLYQRRLTN